MDFKPRAAGPFLEPLEDRSVPALVASQTALALPPPTPPEILSAGEVDVLLQRAASATASDDAIIAIVDRGGNILGVRVEGGVAAAITSDPDLLTFAIDGAVAKARTGAFFANNQAPLTSRTVQFISQSTITERETNSYPFITNPDSPLRGPGFVAPVGVGGHFPPNIMFTPAVDLFGIEHTNRDSIVHPGPDTIKGTADDILLPYRFNIDPAFVPAGQEIAPPLSYGEAILTAAELADPTIPKPQSRGIGTLPGGIPIVEDGQVVGGIGVFFPGLTGFATQENSSLSTTFDPNKADRSLEAEFIAFAAVGGSSGAGFSFGTLGGVAPLPGFDLPFGRIDLVGVTLDIIGPGGDLGPVHLVQSGQALGIGQGDPGSGSNLPVDALGDTLLAGKAVPEGWLVQPHDGVNLTAAEVHEIISQGITEATLVRAQIRLPLDSRTRMVFAVTDVSGEVLGLFRMPDATVFSIDVAVAKARNTAYYNNPFLLQAVDQVAGLPGGVAFTNRSFRYLAQPRFPLGIDFEPPGPFSILTDPGLNPLTGRLDGPPLPASVYDSVFGFDAFHPGTNFRAPTLPQNQNGIVFFPGSSGVYKNVGGSWFLVGGFGVSGDGVDQDDVTTAGGAGGFGAPDFARVDNFFVRSVRLPYFKFPRNPLN